MKLRQLSYLVSIVDNGFNISRAAAVVHTSQPGISTQVRALEAELGVEILVRRRTRVTGITAAGRAVLTVARRMLRDAENLRQLSETPSGDEIGHLVVATTHIYARYVLLDVVDKFRSKYPGVQLVLRQGTPHQIAELVNAGEADIGIGAEPPETYPDLVLLPGFKLARSIIASAGHPVLKLKPLSIAALAKHPIVTLDLHFTGGMTVIRAFENAGYKPNIVLRATDADVIKAYVARGLGIAVLPAIAYEPARDRDIRAIPAGRLFPPTVARIEIRRDNQPRPYMHDFIAMLSPKLTRGAVERVMRS
jgi:LysR family transcriptional regulator, cys regulon transcriptional activator